MKKFLPLIILGLFINCSQDDPQTQNPPIVVIAPKVEQISPQKSRIGDTLIIKGENLKMINLVKFEHVQGMYNRFDKEVLAYSFVTHEDNLIEVVIPPVVHENIKILIGSERYPVDLFGFIPLSNNYQPKQIQTLDENIGFLLEGKKLLKSTDGFYTWSPVIEYIEGYPDTFFFLNENEGWISYSDPISGRGLYYTENGGKDFDLLVRLKNYANGHSRKIYFVNKNLGYLIEGDGNVIVFVNNEAIDLYEYYPQLNNVDIAPIDFWDLTAVNEELLFLAPNDREFLVKIENGNVTYSAFDTWPKAPHFFGDTGYLQANSDIYKSTDLGENWDRIKTFDNHYPRIHFFDEENGMAFVNYTPEKIFRTRNGGTTWTEYPYPATVPMRTSGNETTDLFTGSLGIMGRSLVKYIKE
ncbi:MAG: hypothetical protein ABJ092_15070 [Gillisia sp.]